MSEPLARVLHDELNRLLVDAHGVPEEERIEWSKRLARVAEAQSQGDAVGHPVLAKYGLENMAGDPLEILDRHLTNNRAAERAFKDITIKAQGDAVGLLRDTLDKFAHQWHNSRHGSVAWDECDLTLCAEVRPALAQTAELAQARDARLVEAWQKWVQRAKGFIHAGLQHPGPRDECQVELCADARALLAAHPDAASDGEGTE